MKYGLRLFAGLIGLVVLFVGVFYAFVEFTPFNTATLDAKSPATQVLAGDGSLYMTIGGQGTTNLTYAQLPKNLVNALVATEDHSFWTSSSINFRGIFRSVFVDLLSGSFVQGGSTIEQQLAKVVFLSDKKTLFRKFEQVVLGVQINRYYTKQEILTMYLNKVYLGEGANGVEQAAKRYFGVDLAQNKNALTLPQAALLAGLPQAPNGYDPFVRKSAALARRNDVLNNMVKYGYITKKQAAVAEATPLGVSHHALMGDAWDLHPLFTSFLFDYANRQGISSEELMQGGIKIYTTIKPSVQSAIDTVFWNHNYNGDFPSFSQSAVLQGAALFVDPKTGGVLGGAGSRKDGFIPGGLDRIYSTSSPGSSIKPIMDYAPAIESGKFGPDSILNNAPHDFGGGYIPQNYDRGGAPAKCSLAYALQTSQNVASVYLLQQIGLQTGTSFAENAGIVLSPGNKQQLGVAIGGNVEVSPYMMAQAYSAFANQGVQMQAHLIKQIVNLQGDTIYSYQSAAKRIMSTQTATVMTQLLANVVNQGTGVSAQVPGWQVAGKTGTVQYGASQGDAHSNWLSRVWFDGYTANMVGSVYLGYDTTNATHHMVDFPDPVANCAKVFGDVVTLAEQGVQPIPLNASAGSTPAQPQNVPISKLSAEYVADLNSLTLHWTTQASGQQLLFDVSRTLIALPSQTSVGAGSLNSSQPETAGSTTTSGSDAVAGQQTVLGRTSSTSFTDPTVLPGATYRYTVQPIDAGTQQQVGTAAALTVVIPEGTQGNPGTGTPPGQNPQGNQTTGQQGSGGTNSTDGNTTSGNSTTGQPGQNTTVPATVPQGAVNPVGKSNGNGHHGR